MAGEPSGLEFGVVLGPKGLQGDVQVRAYNAGTERMTPGTALLGMARDAKRSAEPMRPLVIERLRATGSSRDRGRWVVHFHGVDTRTDAESLVGWRLFIPEEDLEPVDDATYYHDRVVGYSAETPSGDAVGTVAYVISAGTDVLVVHDGPREWLLPVVPDVVMAIDHEGRRFVVEIPEGLEPQPRTASPSSLRDPER